MLEKPEGAINDVQSIYTENIGRKTQNDHILKKNTTQKPMNSNKKRGVNWAPVLVKDRQFLLFLRNPCVIHIVKLGKSIVVERGKKTST